MKHDQLSVTTIEFPDSYMKWISEKGGIPTNEFVVLRRSVCFDISQVSPRIEAIRVIVGLMRYLGSN